MNWVITFIEISMDMKILTYPSEYSFPNNEFGQDTQYENSIYPNLRAQKKKPNK